jgi:LmbE family N-acetylglucosaminyl deacetylase
MPERAPLPAAGRVLVVTAHPDDVDFGAAGTVASLVRGGSTVTYLVVTDGDAGGFDPALDRAEIPAIRRAEQRAAASLLGVAEVRFLGRRDGELVADAPLRREVARAIRELRPDLVITSSPERYYDRLPASHPDHLAAGEAALRAVYPDARNRFAFPELLEEGLEPHVVAEVWLMAHPEPDYPVDITELLECKLAAIAAHASQLPDPAGVAERVRAWTAAEAEQLGLGPGRHAEAFRRVRLP